MKRRIRKGKRVIFKDLVSEPYTYNIFKNRHIWFGFMIGLPVPLICFVSHFKICITSPLHLFYLSVPFISAFIFGCFGTFKIAKEAETESYKVLYNIKAQDDAIRNVSEGKK